MVNIGIPLAGVEGIMSNTNPGPGTMSSQAAQATTTQSKNPRGLNSWKGAYVVVKR